MMKIFASPSRYIQGEKALFENAKAIINLGSHPILLTDNVVYDIVGKRFETYLNQERFGRSSTARGLVGVLP